MAIFAKENEGSLGKGNNHVCSRHELSVLYLF